MKLETENGWQSVSDFFEKRMIGQFAVMKLFLTMWSKGRQKMAMPEEGQLYLGAKKNDELQKCSRTILTTSVKGESRL